MKLNDQLAQILNEVDYMKVREMDFHEATESMETNAKWYVGLSFENTNASTLEVTVATRAVPTRCNVNQKS